MDMTIYGTLILMFIMAPTTFSNRIVNTIPAAGMLPFENISYNSVKRFLAIFCSGAVWAVAAVVSFAPRASDSEFPVCYISV